MDIPQTREEWMTLVTSVRATDSKAIEKLAEALGLMVFRFARRQRLSPEDAEDLAQECVWHIFQHLNQFAGGNFTAWAYTIIRRRVADHFRRHHLSIVPLEEGDLNEPISEGANGSFTEHERCALTQALEQLTEKERKVLELRNGREALPYKELAEELCVSPGVARIRYARVRKKLETYLRRDARMQSWFERHGLLATAPKSEYAYEKTIKK